MNATTAMETADGALISYAYSYPHKSSYRRFDPPIPLDEAWRDEDVSRLSLYVHIPFCEMRCGFCNLFTQSQPDDDVVDAYLDTLDRQMQVVRSRIPEVRFSQVAIGGGTPTYLSTARMTRLLEQVERTIGGALRDLSCSVETSPATATPDRLQTLADFGVERISLGVQSFLDEESRRIGRPQRARDVDVAIDAIRDRGFPVFNLDLIYGDPEQSRSSWMSSLREALRCQPEELYLYPLYVRPGTGLAQIGRDAPKHRVELYRAARDELLQDGYEQVSLRCFRRAYRPAPRAGHGAYVPHADSSCPSDYRCQRDGMIGLGCGARSYTRRLHYGTRFAVTQAGVRAILREWIPQPTADLALATHGVRLSREEQMRRFAILSLLQAEGLSLNEYQRQFESDPLVDLPELIPFLDRGWVVQVDGHLRLTSDGMERSDEIGPALYSQTVRSRLREFVQR